MSTAKRTNLGLYSLLIFFLGSMLLLHLLGQRGQTFSLVGLYAVAFCSFFLLIRRNAFSAAQYFKLSILVQIPALFLLPYLSEDAYRYLWDGLMIWEGYSPYAFPPVDFPQSEAYPYASLIETFNSPHYFSIYPPVCQVFFATAALFGFPQGLYVWGLICFASVLLAFWLLKQAVKQGLLSTSQFALIVLNPLLIMECSQANHAEALLLPFLAALFLFFKQGKSWPFVCCFAGAVLVKLWPLLLWPLLWRRWPWKRFVLYSLTLIVIVALSFAPFLYGLDLGGLVSSLQLYFQTFEFNASLFYLVREWGLWSYGWDVIQTAGPRLHLLTLLCLALLLLREWQQGKVHLFAFSTLIYAVYLFSATTVHPWYIVPLLVMGVISGYGFALLWSLTAFFSYHAYQDGQVQEQSLWLLTEYVPVYALFVYELIQGSQLSRFLQGQKFH